MLTQVVLLEVVGAGEALPAARVLARESLGVRVVGSLVAPKIRHPCESLIAAQSPALVWLFTYVSVCL